MPIERNNAVRRRIVLSGVIGNVMEWYDFAVYGSLASVIGGQFFPTDNPRNAIIAAFGAFAAGFVARPLGGVLFGWLGDLVGRRHALLASVMAMAVPTVLLGSLPTYDAIGIVAPVAIVLLRVLQGLAMGGEFTTSVIFLSESAAPGRRARTTIWGFCGCMMGVLLGSGVAALCANGLGDSAMHQYGWRIPFLFGALVAVFGYGIRRGLQTDELAVKSQRPLQDTFGRHRVHVIKMVLLNVGLAVAFYITFVYGITYVHTVDRLSASLALDIGTVAMATTLIFQLTGAQLADRIGRRFPLIAGLCILTFGAIPFFHLMHGSDPATILLGELGLVVGLGLMIGGLAPIFAELMPAAVRCTANGVAYNTAMALFGGTTPLAAAWLVTASGNPIAPAYLVVAACGVSLVAAIFLVPETRNRQLGSGFEPSPADPRAQAD